MNDQWLLSLYFRISLADLETRHRAQKSSKVAGVVLHAAGLLVRLERYANGRQNLVQSNVVEQSDDSRDVFADRYFGRRAGRAWRGYLNTDEQLCGLRKPCLGAIESLTSLHARR